MITYVLKHRATGEIRQLLCENGVALAHSHIEKLKSRGWSIATLTPTVYSNTFSLNAYVEEMLFT